MFNRKTDLFLYLVGDLALNGLYINDPERNEERLSDISGLLKGSNMVCANLEVPVEAGDERNEHKQLIHAGDAEITGALLRRLNIGCVSLANNHIYDCKMSGLKATIELLDEMGIYHTGAGWKHEHVQPVIIDLPAGKVGFIAYVDQCTNPMTEYYPELKINYFELNKVKNEIEILKPCVDKIICSLHWGRDYSYYPTITQLKQARSLVDSGADVIMGHHPHTLQAYENYKNSHIFYSLGNLTYGDFIWEGKMRALKRKAKLGAIAKMNILSNNHPELLALRELQGNKIVLIKKDIFAWMRKKYWITKLMTKFKLIRRCLAFKEVVIDRLMEFCFGYYRKPFKDIFNKKNWAKIGFFRRDYVVHKKS